MRSRDPYDRDQVLDACARHSWQGHAEQFKQHGINSEPELRAHIDKTVERQDARAFRCQPQPERGQTVPREVYNAPLRSDASGKSYETSVVLNPNRDAQGHVHGGTCTIVNAKKGEFERLSRQEHQATGERPRVVTGGREALREQERHQQVSKVERQQGRGQQAEQSLPSREARPEQGQGQAEGQQPRRFDPQARRERLAQEAQERGPPTHDNDRKRGR